MGRGTWKCGTGYTRGAKRTVTLVGGISRFTRVGSVACRSGCSSVQVQPIASCPTVRVIYSMTLRVCVAGTDGFGVGARCGMAGKTGITPNHSNGGLLYWAVQDLVLQREYAGRGLEFHREPSRWLGFDTDARWCTFVR